MKTEYITLNEMAETGNKWAIITINETYHWSIEIIKKAEKIECVYLVNLHEPTNLCELAVSFPAIPLRNFFHKTDKFNEDELWELGMQGGLEEVRYYHGTFKANLINYYQDGEEEEILDYEAGNPSYC